MASKNKPKPASRNGRRSASRGSHTKTELEETRAALRKAEEELHWELGVGSALRDLYEPLISPDSSIEEMARLVLLKAQELTASPNGYVSALDPHTGRVEGDAAATGEAGICGVAGKCRRADGDGDFDKGCAWNQGDADGPYYYVNRETEPVLCSCFGEKSQSVKRFLCIPVMMHGKAAGKIALINAPRDYSARDVKAVRHLAGFYALALDRKKFQTSIVSALREKEVLLREIHHRVKNNLQVITSLLNLQARSLTDPKALEMLKESQNRVRSMAMVHEHLHRSRDLSRIAFREYVHNLCASLFSSYGIDSSRISLRIRVDEVSFAIDTAIPCGLIIQELVSNSLKYAFPDERPGTITIDLQDKNSGELTLRVSDDGIGLPAGLDVFSSNSLGLRLVRILASQVGGTVHCSSEKGTSFSITFRQADESS